MRISRFEVKNYKGIEKLELRIPKPDPARPNSGSLLSIIGKNNAGKSTVLNALHRALELSKLPIEEFYNHDPEHHPVSVEIEFDEVTTRDKDKPAVRPYCSAQGTYNIRIEWSKPNAAPARKVKDVPVIFQRPDGPKSKDNWAKHPHWGPLVKLFEQQYGTFSPKIEHYNKIEQLAVEQKITQVFSYGAEDWQGEELYRSNPAGWQSLLLAALPRVVYVPAIRETKEEAEVSKKSASIRQLVSYMFEKQLDTNKAIQTLREATLRVGKLFSTEEKDNIIIEMERNINRILSPLANVQGHLSFSSGDIGIDLPGYAQLLLKDKHGPITKPEHHGHGTQRALILSLLQALADLESTNKSARGLVLLFEEPEIYLHPEMCRKMRDTLIAISRKPDAQVVCTTHSPVFLDLAERHDGIVLLSKDAQSGKVQCFQRTQDIFRKDDDKEARQRLRMLLSFDPAVNELFFSEEVCLVEGDTEIAAISAIADKLIANQVIEKEIYQRVRHGLTMINCRGKATIPAFQRVLNEFGIKYRVVHDSDSNKNSAPLRTANSKIADAIKEIHPDDSDAYVLIHEPNFEKHLFNDEYSEDKPWKASLKIAQLDSIEASSPLLRFFTFVLNRSLTDLAAQPPPATSGVSSDTQGARHCYEAPRRNTRNNYAYREVLLRSGNRLSAGAVIGIAAGPGRIDGLDEFLACEPLPPELLVAKVMGDSMLDTFRSGEMVLLRKLDITLPSENDPDRLIAIEKFRENIGNNKVYVLAINDDVNRCAYTIKRVLYSGTGVDWICRIVADNPQSDWHTRGEFVVRRTDQVHFAAEVVALVKDLARPEPAVEDGDSLDTTRNQKLR